MPRRTLPRFTLRRVFFTAKKDFIRAVDMFKKALLIDKGRFAAIYGLAMGYEELGLKDEAWRCGASILKRLLPATHMPLRRKGMLKRLKELLLPL